MNKPVIFFLYALVIFVSYSIIISVRKFPQEIGNVARTYSFVDDSVTENKESSLPQAESLVKKFPLLEGVDYKTTQIPNTQGVEKLIITPSIIKQVEEKKNIVPTQKAETKRAVVNTKREDPFTVIPKNINHTVIQFKPFVVPPPIRTRNMKFTPLQDFSDYYLSLKAASANCNSDICKHPRNYLNQFSSWNCSRFPSLCADPSAILIMQEPKYLEGRIDVVENGVVSQNLDCGWPADLSMIESPFDSRLYGHFPGTLVPLVVPEGLSFQHFIDGVIPKLVILADILRKEPSVTLAMDMRIIKDMPKLLLQRLGLQKSSIVSWERLPWKNGKVYADKLIMGCKVPPLHPELWQKAQDLFDLPWKKEGWKQKRHVVLYLSRSEGTSNPGRNVLNEKELVGQLQKWANKKGFELVVFKASNYPVLDDLFSFLADVDVVIGPHGGAFYNMIFMRRGITVIEFMPDSRSFLSTSQAVHLIIYLQASLLGNNYFNIRSVDKGHSNINVNPSLVLEALNTAFM